MTESFISDENTLCNQDIKLRLQQNIVPYVLNISSKILKLGIALETLTRTAFNS